MCSETKCVSNAAKLAAIQEWLEYQMSDWRCTIMACHDSYKPKAEAQVALFKAGLELVKR